MFVTICNYAISGWQWLNHIKKWSCLICGGAAYPNILSWCCDLPPWSPQTADLMLLNYTNLLPAASPSFRNTLRPTICSLQDIIHIGLKVFGEAKTVFVQCYWLQCWVSYYRKAMSLTNSSCATIVHPKPRESNTQWFAGSWIVDLLVRVKPQVKKDNLPAFPPTPRIQ